MKTVFRILFKSLAWLLGLLFVTLFALVFFGVNIDLSFLRGGVEAAASKALNREVSIQGPVELEFSNWPAINISDVKIANIADADQTHLLNAGFARMQIGMVSLFRGEINIADITAKNIQVNLQSDAEGNPNWIFGKPDEGGVDKPDTKLTKPLPAASEHSERIQFIGLSSLSLRNIEVNYSDAALDKTMSFILDELEATAAEEKPVRMMLNGRVQDKNYALELEGGSIADLLNSQTRWEFSSKGEIAGKQIAGKGNFLLRGETPQLDLALGARDLDVGLILSNLGLVKGMQASLGDVGIDIKLKGDSLHEVLQQSSMFFSVNDGDWTIAVPNTDASFQINDLQGKIKVEEGNNLSMALHGDIQDVPVNLFITGAPLVEYVTRQNEIPLTVDAELLESRLSFSANVSLPISEPDMSFALKVRSERIDRLEQLFRLDLPPLGPVVLESKLDISAQAYDLSNLDVRVGESHLTGSLKLNTSLAKPYLDMKVVSDLIQLDDFDTGEPTLDDQAKASPAQDESEVVTEGQKDSNSEQKIKPFSYAALKTLDADINIEARQLVSGEDMLGSSLLNINLKDARLKVQPLTINVPGGGIDFNLDYAPSAADEGIDLNIQANVDKFDIGIMLRRLRPGTDMGGLFVLDLELDTQAPDLASVMEYANGHLDFGLVPENFSSGVIDLWAVNLLSAIMDKSTEKSAAVVNCVVVRFDLEDGIMQEDAIYMDTSEMRIAGKTEVNFKTRELEIKLAPKAKRPEFFSVAIPIQVKGKLDDFDLKIGVMRMAGQVVSFLTSPVHVPIRRVFTEDDPEDGVEACKAAWNRTVDKTVDEKPQKPQKLWY